MNIDKKFLSSVLYVFLTSILFAGILYLIIGFIVSVTVFSFGGFNIANWVDFVRFIFAALSVFIVVCCCCDAHRKHYQ